MENKAFRERLYDAMELASKFFKNNLESNTKALEYLEKRGINEIAISKFSLGLAPKGNFELKNYLPQDEGSISISQLCFDTKISRPVYKSLFQKLKECGLIEIKNQGVNGTYIKFISKKNEV